MIFPIDACSCPPEPAASPRSSSIDAGDAVLSASPSLFYRGDAVDVHSHDGRTETMRRHVQALGQRAKVMEFYEGEGCARDEASAKTAALFDAKARMSTPSERHRPEPTLTIRGFLTKDVASVAALRYARSDSAKSLHADVAAGDLAAAQGAEPRRRAYGARERDAGFSTDSAEALPPGPSRQGRVASEKARRCALGVDVEALERRRALGAPRDGEGATA